MVTLRDDASRSPICLLYINSSKIHEENAYTILPSDHNDSEIEHMTVYILGGGPSGLAVAHGLLKDTKQDFVLIEQQPTTGGLAQTLHWKGVGYHDLGPHKIFSLDEQLVHKVKSLLPNSDWLSIKKTSSIYLNGCYLNYPPSPFSLIRVFGFKAFVMIVCDYSLAVLVSLFGKKHSTTFEHDLTTD